MAKKFVSPVATPGPGVVPQNYPLDKVMDDRERTIREDRHAGEAEEKTKMKKKQSKENLI